MKDSARVVVIGGGVVGASVLYHLTRLGWSDVMLIERSELTSGSTWHAAGGMHTLNGDPNVAKLQAYTIELYKEIEEISGQATGAHQTGGVLLADSQERMQWLKMAHARGRYLGMETELISVSEAKTLYPLLEEKYFVGAMYDPVDGHVDPSGVTQAYAKSARLNGAEIVLRNRVVELNQRPDGTWNVVTEQGAVHAEHVVNAGGLWAREVGRMVGLELPLLAMEHMYLLTEDMPEVAEINRATGKEVLHAIDFGGEIYMRQERGGMLMGTYERAGRPWSPKATPWDFGHELLQPDLDRIAPSLEVGFRHFPAFERAGIKQIINGPFTFAPDGNPLVGPVRGLRNFWCACAVMAGFSQGGGVGLALSNWIVNGDPGFDVWAMDVSRYGDWTTMAYTSAKVRENYSRRFSITFPNEELTAGRPLRTTPIHGRLKAENAVFGASYGLEHALWFQEPGRQPVEDVTFQRSNSHEPVARECRAVRDGVGMIEISSFAKYQVTGPGAELWLSRMLANRMPKTGRIVLSPMLNDAGRLIGDFTVARAGDERFYVFGSGIAENYHMRWFQAHLPNDGRVAIRPLGLDLTGLSLAGPRARDVLQAVTDHDVSAENFRFMDFRRIEIGMIPALAGRITFTGDLGFEIWVKPEFLAQLYDMLQIAGEEHGLTLFGARALNGLRLEKNFGTWAREYRPVYGPEAAGLSRFVDFRKNDFTGRDAALREREEGPPRKLVALKVDAGDADVIGDEPIWIDGRVRGWVTSGGFAHASDASVALGYVEAAFADETEAPFDVEIIGERRPARLLEEPLFDPQGARMRA
ncbi:GcvT family protein [Minwuia thermotolerans]|uniref:Glycine cleavage system protein T n=1 Tax=Minwuia thermotolerans TaxID=2056226 RepID=A0A2M9G2Y2_9PROT|nr:FAD-dependent oxidoreductase [Minwuia thermotolerans]PJK30087.1 glycine cleavage system protein T [Minwuia thermotolerans]